MLMNEQTVIRPILKLHVYSTSVKLPIIEPDVQRDIMTMKFDIPSATECQCTESDSWLRIRTRFPNLKSVSAISPA